MNELIMENEMMRSFYNISAYFKDLFEEEISFAITDLEKYLIYIPTENINPNIKAGDLIKAGTSSYNCIQSGEL
ncbi:MAG: hypothetical protein U1E11_08890, partial [Dethiobacteria bacterium]|nr:hypothetical protein [Dethiobacteria bacterium]